LSPQLTEQPPQLPRGEEAGALQELLPVARSESGGPEAAVRGGPVSPEEPLSLFATVAQPAQHSSVATRAAQMGDPRSAIERVLMRSVKPPDLPACYA
jgi:hypothetical protein